MVSSYEKIKLSIAVIIIALSILIILSFNSYWINGIFDQSEIIDNTKNYINVKNITGGLGALVSNFFITIFGPACDIKFLGDLVRRLPCGGTTPKFTL